jgi:hypothetical protein
MKNYSIWKKQAVWVCKVVNPRFENVALLYLKESTLSLLNSHLEINQVMRITKNAGKNFRKASSGQLYSTPLE